ncbi:MAG TPA: threonine-phosphate decarboxylase, partial [Paracoccus solventivorans]|nr:threonine-phosphate decarboxylase [Paracoccus solventivorans]
MRDHGGNLDAARGRYGEGDWIDLSTGINRVPYPLPAIPAAAWQALPDRAATAGALRGAPAGHAARGGVLARGG